jgi:hypothetical protein
VAIVGPQQTLKLSGNKVITAKAAVLGPAGPDLSESYIASSLQDPDTSDRRFRGDDILFFQVACL